MPAVAGFRVGTVIRRTVDILGGNMPPFLGIALLFGFLPQVLSLALLPRGAPGGSMPASSFAPGLLLFLLAVLGKGAVVAAALACCEGRPWSFRSAVGIGSAAFPSNLGVFVLDYLGVGLASLLLVFPGLMLLCRWVVAVPANMAEQPGVLAALGRSRDLTEGFRWPVFGLLVLFGFLSAVVPVAAMLVALRRGANADLDALTLVNALSAAVFGLVGSVGTAVLYAELRASKGGAPSSGLMSAFD